jgi:hypothetical protein
MKESLCIHSHGRSKKLETRGKITHKISKTFKNYVYHQSYLDIKSLQYLFRGPLEGVGILGVTFIKLFATKHKDNSHCEQFSFSDNCLPIETWPPCAVALETHNLPLV